MATLVKHRILVVEDEPLIASELQRSLHRLGYDVLPTASSAGAAVALALAHEPDLVLMDLHIEGAADGVEAADAIKSHVNVPVVFLTAMLDDDTVGRAKRASPYGYIVKPVRSDDLRGVIDVALDKHQLEKQLRERERWFSTTLRSIADGVISVDTDGVVTFMNAAAEFMTGVATHDGVGRPIRDVLQLEPLLPAGGDAAPEPPAETPLERTLREGRVVELPEARLKNLTNGEELIIADSAAQVIADGEVLGAVMVFHNITAQKQMQETLLISDRMASVGLLAAGVAHEINNPLTVVMANVATVVAALSDASANAGSHPAAAEQLELLQDVGTASLRIRDIVRDLMLFSRSESVERRNIDLRSVLEASIRLAHNAVLHHARVETQYGAVPLVHGSESRLGQVFLNLLVNAAQAMPESACDGKWIQVTLRTGPEGDAVVEIADNGCGMSDATLKRLFTPFFTTKPIGAGTGLGLSICRRIVTTAGGSIHVASQLGRGTTIRIVLPASTIATETRVVAPVVVPHEPTARRARVMVIDDDPLVARVLARLLVANHDVEVFEGAAVALARIAQGQRYDIIVCDLMMPGLSGMDFQVQLVQLNPEQAQRIVFLTGGGFSARAQEFAETTRTPILVKPVDVSALRALVDQSARTSPVSRQAGSRATSGEEAR